MNNPIVFTDPDGMGSYDENGKWVREVDDFNSFFNRSWKGTAYTLKSGDAAGNGGGSINMENLFNTLLAFGPSFKFPKGTEEYYKEQYPAFYNLVTNILPKMTNDKNFMEALSSVSGFSIEELKEIFQYGKGAIIKDGGSLPFGDAEYPYARLEDKSLINTISADEKVLDWYEKANKNTNSLEGVTNTFWMIMTIGHETGHWGDWTKRTVRFKDTQIAADFSNEIGLFFEYRAMRSTFPNVKEQSSLYIGNYGPNISEIFKTFIKQNFKSFSNILSK
nr:hypothetical protein [Chryseobacterium daecheongense]